MGLGLPVYDAKAELGPGLPFEPYYRLCHPEIYLFSLSTKNSFQIKVSEKIFNFILKTKHWLGEYRYGHVTGACTEAILISEVFLAEISLRSARKLFIFIILKDIFWIKVSKKILNLILKKT